MGSGLPAGVPVVGGALLHVAPGRERGDIGEGNERDMKYTQGESEREGRRRDMPADTHTLLPEHHLSAPIAEPDGHRRESGHPF